jgi:hypothetical protein
MILSAKYKRIVNIREFMGVDYNKIFIAFTFARLPFLIVIIYVITKPIKAPEISFKVNQSSLHSTNKTHAKRQ